MAILSDNAPGELLKSEVSTFQLHNRPQPLQQQCTPSSDYDLATCPAYELIPAQTQPSLMPGFDATSTFKPALDENKF